MSSLTITDSSLRCFGEPEGTLVVVTAPDLEILVRFDLEAARDTLVVTYDGSGDFAEVLRRQVPEIAHVLVILPNVYFRSPSAEQLGATRKLAVMACSSTPTSLDAIRHFIDMSGHTDPQQQEDMAEAFFANAEQTDALVFVNDEFGTKASFDHLSDDLNWHEQGGYLDWGQQQLYPSGEISVLPVAVFGQNIVETFRLSGQLVFHGVPILHSGTPSFSPADQQRLYDSLAPIQDAPVVASVVDGRITELTATGTASGPAVQALEALRTVDSRYGRLVEIGFGINTGLSLFPGNTAMNEVYGGSTGAVHFGFGLIPYTQYHLDVICPGTRVVGSDGEHVFGPKSLAAA